MECHENPLHTGECAKIWRADDLGDIELLHARYISYSFSRHMHEGAAVGVIEEGVEGFQYRGAKHVAPAGQVVIFNANEAHTGEAVNEHGWRFRMFYLDSALLKTAAQELCDRPRDIPFFPVPVIDDPETAAMIRQLHKSLEAGGTPLERGSKFLWTFAHLVKRHADAPAQERVAGDEKAVVRKIKHYLEDRYCENVTLNDLSSHSGLSPYHLIRVFRAETGLPPHVYLEQVRINRARQFLRHGIPIIDVAFRTGFADQAHFSRHFKRMTGVTPGQYRQTARSFKTGPAPKAQAGSR